MFDAQCDVAALVYETDDDPDALLRDFAADLNADGIRAIGMHSGRPMCRLQLVRRADPQWRNASARTGSGAQWQRLPT